MYAVSSALRTAKSQDGTIVLDVQHGRLFRLNATAYLILTHLEQGHAEAQIVRAISEEWHIPSDVARRDVCDLLNALERYGLVQTTSEASPEASPEAGRVAILP